MELTLAIRNKLASRGLCFDEQHLVMHDMALSLFTSICKSPNNSWVRQFSRSIPLDDRPPRRMLNHLAGVWEVFTVRRSSSRRLWSASEFTQNASEFPLLGFHARIYLKFEETWKTPPALATIIRLLHVPGARTRQPVQIIGPQEMQILDLQEIQESAAGPQETLTHRRHQFTTNSEMAALPSLLGHTLHASDRSASILRVHGRPLASSPSSRRADCRGLLSLNFWLIPHESHRISMTDSKNARESLRIAPQK